MTSKAFYLLSREMQEAVWRMQWESFYPIQEEAIPAIIQGGADVILCADTAAGKTEAAFLPILSLVGREAREKLKVLYISPLKALINDQFRRLGELCQAAGVEVFRWHGDVSQGHKNKLIKRARGILQITPESLESLFINRTSQVPYLFENLEFLVIDEVHSFWGTERGAQLRSLLFRVFAYTRKKPRLVALSATISDPEYARRWLNPSSPAEVTLLAPAQGERGLKYCLMYFARDKSLRIPLELYEDLRTLTRNFSAIIFCNSRSQVEETCHLLSRLAEREGVGETYYPHHSSISAAEREFVEDKLKTSAKPVSVVSTSTLELGIDIGRIDLVAQIDSTFTVAALKQRLGRSGRKPGAKRILQLYATQEESLLQSIAVMELLREGWLEPPGEGDLPYDVLFHQLLSLVVEKNGCRREELVRFARQNPAFSMVDLPELEILLDEMAEKDYLQLLPSGEYILGLEGERILRSKDFYAVFTTEEEYSVKHGDRIIGSVTRLPIYRPGVNIILAGRLWTITQLDFGRHIIYVDRAVAAKPPAFSGSGGMIHQRVRDKMAEVLTSQDDYPYLVGKGVDFLAGLRQEARQMGMTKSQFRPLLDREGWYELRAFAGDREAYTLSLMFKLAFDVDARPGRTGSLVIPKKAGLDVLEALKQLTRVNCTPDELMQTVEDDAVLKTKFSVYLPLALQRKLHAGRYIDIDGARNFLQRIQVVPLT